MRADDFVDEVPITSRQGTPERHWQGYETWPPRGMDFLTHQPIDPVDCAEAILFLASARSRCTTGHLIPVDGGLAEAFLR